jgi:large conductance mechanosensitive channel
MKKFFKEFKEFVLRGNVLNLAVGIIIGAAFQGIVTSLTTNILTPVLEIFTGKNNFENMHASVLGADIKFGAFITSVIDFLIMAFVVFLLVKFVNKIMTISKKPAAPEPPKTRECPFCMTVINIKATKCPACTSDIQV